MDYSKGSKQVSTGSEPMIKAGGSSGENSGPTGSSRSYPKGKGNTHNTDWNPMKCKASTYGVDGCC